MAGKDTQVLDETWEIGDNAPHERTDMPIDRSDFGELTVHTAAVRARGVRMARLLKWGDTKTKKWCEHCKANHWSTTKCPFLEKQKKRNPGSTGPKENQPTAPSKAALPKNLPEKTQKKLLDTYGGSVADSLGEALSNLPPSAHGFGLDDFLKAVPEGIHENAEKILKQLTDDGILKQKPEGGWAFVDKPAPAPELSAPGVQPPSVESLGGVLEKLPVEGWEPGAAQTLAAGILDLFGKGKSFGDILDEQTLRDGLAGASVDPKVIDLALGALKNAGILQATGSGKLKLSPGKGVPVGGVNPTNVGKLLAESGMNPGMSVAVGKVLLKQFLKNSPDGVGVSIPEKTLTSTLIQGHGWTPVAIVQGIAKLKASGFLVDDGLGGLSLGGPATLPKPGSNKAEGAKPVPKIFDGKALAKHLGFPGSSIGAKALVMMGYAGVPRSAEDLYASLDLKGGFEGLGGKKLTNLLESLVDDGQLQKIEPTGGGPAKYFFGSWAAPEPVTAPAAMPEPAAEELGVPAVEEPGLASPEPAPVEPEEVPAPEPPEPGALPTDEAVPPAPGEVSPTPEEAPIPEPETPPPGMPEEAPAVPEAPTGLEPPPAAPVPAPEVAPEEVPAVPATPPESEAGQGPTPAPTDVPIYPELSQALSTALDANIGLLAIAGDPDAATSGFIQALQHGPTSAATLFDVLGEHFGASVTDEEKKGILDAITQTGLIQQQPDGTYTLPGDPAPAPDTKPTGTCSSGHKTYKSPLPHNCPTCGKVLAPTGDAGAATPATEAPAEPVDTGWGMSDDEPSPEPDYAPPAEKYDMLNGLGGPYHEALQKAGMTFDSPVSFLNLLKDTKAQLAETPDKAGFAKAFVDYYTPEDTQQVVAVLDALGVFGGTPEAPTAPENAVEPSTPAGGTALVKDVLYGPTFLQDLKNQGIGYPGILSGDVESYFEKTNAPTKEGLAQHLADDYTPEKVEKYMQALETLGLFGGEEPTPATGKKSLLDVLKANGLPTTDTYVNIIKDLVGPDGTLHGNNLPPGKYDAGDISDVMVNLFHNGLIKKNSTTGKYEFAEPLDLNAPSAEPPEAPVPAPAASTPALLSKMPDTLGVTKDAVAKKLQELFPTGSEAINEVDFFKALKSSYYGAGGAAGTFTDILDDLENGGLLTYDNNKYTLGDAAKSVLAAPPGSAAIPAPEAKSIPAYSALEDKVLAALSKHVGWADPGDDGFTEQLIDKLQAGPTSLDSLLATLQDHLSMGGMFDGDEVKKILTDILSDVAKSGLIQQQPSGLYSLTGDPAPAAGAQPTGTCPDGHKTYKSPLPHNCPTCGKVLASTPAAPPAPPPVLSATPNHEAFDNLGINPGGKSITFLKTLNTKGTAGLTLEEALAACPNPPSGTPKITQLDAEALLKKAVGEGLVSEVPGSSPTKYVFGKITGTPTPPRFKSFDSLLGILKIEPDSTAAKVLKGALKPDGTLDFSAFEPLTPEMGAGIGQVVNALVKANLIDNSNPASLKLKGTFESAPTATPSPSPAAPVAAPKFTKFDTSDAVSELGWAADGKGQKLLTLLNQNGSAGSTVEDVLNAWGDATVKPKKPDTGLAQTLLDKAVAKQLVQQVPGTSPPKYVFGYFGDTKPAPPAPPPLGAAPTGITLQQPSEKAYNPSDVEHGVIQALQGVTAMVAPAPLPKVTAPAKPAPDGVPNAVYELAHKLGQDLHNPAQLAAFMATPEAKLATLLDADPRTAGFLSSQGFSQAQVQKLVNDGLFEVDSPNTLFSSGGDWEKANISRKAIRREGDKAFDVPTPTKVTYTPGPDGAKRSYEMDPDVADALGGWEAAGMPPAVKSLITMMSTAPDKRWSAHDIAHALATPGNGISAANARNLFAAIPPHLAPLFERLGNSSQQNIRLNLPVLMSATATGAGPVCPKCKVHHRPTTQCPQATGPDTLDLTGYYYSSGVGSVYPGQQAFLKACADQAATNAVPKPEPLPAGASGPVPAPSPTGKAMSVAEATGLMGAKPGTIGHTVLSALATPQSMATLEAVLTSNGFKWKPKSFLEKALTKGAVEKLPSGEFALKGTYAAQMAVGLGPGPSIPGPGEKSHLIPDMPPQSLPTLVDIRQQYTDGHPIHSMKPEHAARFHQLSQYFRSALDPKTHPGLQRVPAAKRDAKAYLLAAGAAQTGYARAANMMFGSFWCGHQASYGGLALVGTLNQLGINRSPTVATLQNFSANTGDITGGQETALQQLGVSKSGYGVSQKESGVHMFMHSKDVDAPTVMQIELNKYPSPADVAKAFDVPPDQVVKGVDGWFIKGPSRGEILLQQLASQQAAFQHAGESSASLFRGIKDGPPHYPVTKMKAEHPTAMAAKGHGSKVFLNAGSSWSISHSVAKGGFSSGGIVMQKTIPNFENVYTCLQEIASPAFGASATPDMIFHKHASEDEYIILGHSSKTLDQPEVGKLVKISQLEEPPSELDAWPAPDPQIPPGFGRLVTNGNFDTFWVTSTRVMYCVPPMVDPPRAPQLDIPLGGEQAKSAA